jgi:hypothetical protein
MILAACLLYLVIFAAGMMGTGVRAAPDAPTSTYAIPWWTVDNGGGTSQGGVYILNGTIGQPDAGSLSGGIYTLKGGFWSGLLNYIIHVPVVSR